MGCFNRCCFDEGEDITACEHWADVLDFTFHEDMDPIDRDDCWVPWDDENGAAETGCKHCEVGCDAFEDTTYNLLRNYMSLDGRSYLRGKPAHVRGRDSQNRIFDLPTGIPWLIGRYCRLEIAACHENTGSGGPDGLHAEACWGYHTCQCSPLPDYVPPCAGGVEVGNAVSGLIQQMELFNYQRYPPQGGISVANPLFCRKWLVSEYLGSFAVHRQNNNAVFLRGGQTQPNEDALGWASDKLICCAGRIPNSGCVNDLGDDCTFGAGGRTVGDPSNDHQASQGVFDEVRIQAHDLHKRSDNPNLSAQQLRENVIHQEVLDAVIYHTFDYEGGSITFDRLAMPTADNAYIGYYERAWQHYPLSGDPPTLAEFPHSYTKWGGVPYLVKLVAAKIRVVLHLNLQHQGKQGIDELEETVGPYSEVEVVVETGILADPLPSPPVHVNGELVTVTNPTMQENGSYDGPPVVTPMGNDLRVARELDGNGKPLLVRLPKYYRWHGKLGSFSYPAIDPVNVDLHGGSTANCGELALALGQWTVPGLADALASFPTDPNRNYAGSITFEFVYDV